MTKYIALLRGINVGGHKKILMAELRQLFKDLGFDNISTYIQTGNVIFSSSSGLDNLSLAETIERGIQKHFGFEVPVMVRTTKELQIIADQTPYWNSDNQNIDSLHLTLLDKAPTNELLEKIKTATYEPDNFEVIDQSIFLYCPRQYKDTKLGNNFFERKLKVKATTRNWKTVIKILELAAKEQ